METIERRTFAPALPALLALAAASPGCSGSADIGEWRAAGPEPRPAVERGSLEEDFARVEALRKSLDLEASRRLALTLAAEYPADARVLHLASRAESDGLCLLEGPGREERDLAALSALDYAERAAEAGAATADSLAQLAWALGTTTHLRSMFSRAGHAQRTLETVERALAIDGEHPRALATLSVLRLRLATLPWIARAMAWGAPDGSIEEAVSAAERCVAREPSIEYRLQLARALSAAERKDDAASALRQAVAAPDTFPRDREMRPAARDLLVSIEGGGS